MLDYKVLGTFMVVPTVLVALSLAAKTRRTPDFLMNVSVLCWISANAFWMCCEFYSWNESKTWAVVPFLLGMLFITLFFIKNRRLL